MNIKLKILLIFIAVCIVHTIFMYHPVILASFDDIKYVDGEVFTPVNGEYDFKKFSLNSSQTSNYTTIVNEAGYTQLLDDGGNKTINVFEWDKMTGPRRERLNSSFMIELRKPSHITDGIVIIEGEYMSTPFYCCCIDDPNSNDQIYIATPSENETVEMAKTLNFK